MSAIDNLEQVERWRELSPNDEPIEGLFIELEMRFIAGAAEVEREIERRRATPPDAGGWRDPEAARERLAALDADAAREHFRSVRDQVLADLARIPMGYHDMRVLGLGPIQSLEAAKALVISLHNPAVRETLLLPIAEPWQAEAREALVSVAALAWGFVETLTLDDQGEHYRTYLAYLADHWDMEVEELEDIMLEFSEQVQSGDV